MSDPPTRFQTALTGRYAKVPSPGRGGAAGYGAGATVMSMYWSGVTIGPPLGVTQ